MSDRSSPIVLSLPETTMSDRSSPIVLSLPETTMSDRSSPIISLCDRAPNDLFTNFFFPSIQRLSNHKNRGVPIFSCSWSVKQELWVTEEYDCFFPQESPVESEDDAPVHMATRFDNQANEPLHTMLGADTYEHFFTDKDWRGNLFWKNPLSLRRLRFTGGLYSSCDRSISWAFAATGWRESSSLFRTTDPGNTVDDRGTSHPCPNLYLENQLCSELREQRDTNLQAVVSFPKKGFLFTLKQSDICLVCIAFASWVLKSANPQSEDTWKTVLLANVSAISAIQYLRRYIREDASGNKR
ncbi:hypothetical protein SKAU_G00172920 [Synaphobranchus kaupii]|uniref:Uncharacterized protein n=1 Tax=Synaphobranchus kaupii TaxID=118154 RepID=A0A9Q1J117_SYNKA|nr:hypothetical protein SKAU_G00172920 [Synaphobranchus kaupii]